MFIIYNTYRNKQLIITVSKGVNLNNSIKHKVLFRSFTILNSSTTNSPSFILQMQISKTLSISFFKRFMFSRLKPITSYPHNMHKYPNFRNMSSLHGGTLFKKLGRKTALDDSGKHKVVTQTTCEDSKCLQRNCADPHNKDICPYENPQEHQQRIPVTNNKAKYETQVVGNLTSKVPHNRTGAIVDHDINYTGKNKKQEIVLTIKPHIINHNDLKINKEVTAYVQKPKHHEAINKALHNDHED